jgi:putative transposase
LIRVNWSLALRKEQTMKRRRHTEEQIIAILKVHEPGLRRPICAASTGSARGASTTGRGLGGQAPEGAGERERPRLKKLLADAMLDNAALKNLLAKC